MSSFVISYATVDIHRRLGLSQEEKITGIHMSLDDRSVEIRIDRETPMEQRSDRVTGGLHGG